MISLIFSWCMAAELKGIEYVQAAIKRYNSAPGVTMQVKKTVKLSLLDETRTSEGKLFFSKGRLRLEISKPDDSLIVLNPEAIWVENTMEGFDGPSKHVMKIVSKDLKKRSKAPLALLLTSTSSWGDFKVLNEEFTDGVVRLELKPKDTAKYSDMAEVNVSIGVANKDILRLSYVDEIENEVIYEFAKTDAETKIANSKFAYKPPKGAEVVVY